jgi:hypothetical protein
MGRLLRVFRAKLSLFGWLSFFSELIQSRGIATEARSISYICSIRGSARKMKAPGSRHQFVARLSCNFTSLQSLSDMAVQTLLFAPDPEHEQTTDDS